MIIVMTPIIVKKLLLIIQMTAGMIIQMIVQIIIMKIWILIPRFR